MKVCILGAGLCSRVGTGESGVALTVVEKDSTRLRGREWAENILSKNREKRMDEMDSVRTLLETMSFAC